jgi:hypothetical protein
MTPPDKWRSVDPHEKAPTAAVTARGRGRLDGVDVTHDTGTQPAAALLDVRTMLELPAVGELSEQQYRGITCVWDGIALTPATAVDLGPRRMRHLDGHRTWFPRGCRRCTQVAALRMLHRHAIHCVDCQDDYQSCAVGHGLNRLLRECR